jgi:dephospho-CoA kinase
MIYYKLIGFTGKMQNGKSLSASLIKNINNNYQICSFGNRVKEIATELGWNGKKDKNGRKILQYLGTEVGRLIDDKYWINELDKYIKDNDLKYILIDDVRFQNELNYIKNNGGIIIHIEKRNKLKIIFDKFLEFLGLIHKSERSIKGISKN